MWDSEARWCAFAWWDSNSMELAMKRGNRGWACGFGISVALAMTPLLATQAASAQSYSASTTWRENVDVQDLRDNSSPGNFHLYLTPVTAYLGRVTAFGGGGGFDWELANNFAIRAEGYYPYTFIKRDDRENKWWRAEAGFRIHTSSDKLLAEDIDIENSSQSTRYGDYVLTQSSREWINRSATHRITHGLSAGILAQRSPTKIEVGSVELFPLSTELTVYAGYSHTDSVERTVYVTGHGVRGNVYFNRLYADLLVTVARDFGDTVPDEDPDLFGFRAGVEGIYASDFGLGGKFEFGMNPGRAQGWYMMANLSLGFNGWLGAT